MKVLDFTISGQSIKRDPRCDFTGIVAGSSGYLRARFHFSADWAGCKKVAVFGCKGKECPVPLTGNQCNIPAEALTGSAVQVFVVGQRGSYRLATNTAAFPQIVR